MADMMGELIAARKIVSYRVSEWSPTHIREADSVVPMVTVRTKRSNWRHNAANPVFDSCRELRVAVSAFSPAARRGLAESVRELSAPTDYLDAPIDRRAVAGSRYGLSMQAAVDTEESSE